MVIFYCQSVENTDINKFKTSVATATSVQLRIQQKVRFACESNGSRSKHGNEAITTVTRIT